MEERFFYKLKKQKDEIPYYAENIKDNKRHLKNYKYFKRQDSVYVEIAKYCLNKDTSKCEECSCKCLFSSVKCYHIEN